MKVVINPAIHPYQSRCSPEGGKQCQQHVTKQTQVLVYWQQSSRLKAKHLQQQYRINKCVRMDYN